MTLHERKNWLVVPDNCPPPVGWPAGWPFPPHMGLMPPGWPREAQLNDGSITYAVGDGMCRVWAFDDYGENTDYLNGCYVQVRLKDAEGKLVRLRLPGSDVWSKGALLRIGPTSQGFGVEQPLEFERDEKLDADVRLYGYEG